MNRFFATFPSGTQEIVRRILLERLEDVKILSLFDGGVDFETAVPYSSLNLFCFHNVFLVLYRAPAPSGSSPLDSFAERLPSAPIDWALAKSPVKKAKTFRLAASCRNRLTSLRPRQRAALEKQLAEASGLTVDRSLPDLEFWVLYRDEGYCWLLKRLSRHTAYDKLLHPGELHPEIAYLMCWLTHPQHTDIVLDPFCGYGAIPGERCKRFPYTKTYAFDKDKAVLGEARKKLGKNRSGLILEQHDALALDRILPESSVDAVITDPPWGLFRDAGTDLHTFYLKMAGQLARVLKPGGSLVLLTAQKECFLEAAQAAESLVLKESFDILVSGKKAGIYCFEKSS